MSELFRRTALSLISLAVVAACGEMTEEEIQSRAAEIHSRVIAVDTHDDIPTNFATAEVDPGVRGDRKVDLPKMTEGGLDVAFFVVYVGQTPRTPENYARANAEAMTKFEAIRRLTSEMHPDRIELALSPDDVERIHASGKLAAAIGVENGYSIGKDITLIPRFYELGARYFSMTHSGHNDIGDSSNPRNDEEESEHGGLSAFGEEVVAELNRVGIMVDVSHAAKSTMLDVVRVSRAPIIASHSGISAIADVSRNLDDEQLLALKENGGVVQAVALGSFVKVQPPERGEALRAIREDMGITGGFAGMRNLSDEQRAEYRRRVAALDEQWPPANLQDFVDHIDHAVDLIGIDHVGISSDFDGGGGIVGWNDASETRNVTVELVRRGYSEEDIGKLWGGNLLRVWREVERVAAELRGEQ